MVLPAIRSGNDSQSPSDQEGPGPQCWCASFETRLREASKDARTPRTRTYRRYFYHLRGAVAGPGNNIFPRVTYITHLRRYREIFSTTYRLPPCDAYSARGGSI